MNDVIRKLLLEDLIPELLNPVDEDEAGLLQALRLFRFALIEGKEEIDLISAIEVAFDKVGYDWRSYDNDEDQVGDYKSPNQ